MREEFHFRGSGGQGILSMGLVLAYAGMQEGLEVSWIPSYGAERRGGTSFCAVTLSDRPVDCPVTESPTFLFAMDERAARKYAPRLSRGAVLVYNRDLIPEAPPPFGGRVLGVPVNRLATEAGMPASANMAALGAVLAVKPLVSSASVEAALAKVLGPRKAHLVPANLKAFEAAFASVPPGK